MRVTAVALLSLCLGFSAEALPIVQIGVEFDGADSTQSTSIPPDTMGAAGDEHVVVLLNGRYSAFRKSDGQLVATSTMNQFWTDAGVTTSRSFDPRIVFDEASQRWFAIAAEDSRSTTSAYLVGVSKTANPTDGFTAFRIDADSTNQTWADFPMLGIDAEGVYISAPAFPVNGPDAPVGNNYLVLPKNDLLAPVPTIANATIFERRPISAAGFQPQAVVNLDGGGLPAKFYAGTLTFLGQIQTSQIAGTIEAPTFSGGGFIAIDALGEPPDLAQPGTKQTLDGGDSRFGSNAVLQNGVVWAVQAVDVDGRSAVRWVQIDPVNDIVLDWDVIADPNLDLSYPSIAVNEFDEIVIGMSGSGESTFASAFAVVGEKVGGITSFGDLILLAAGTADYERTGSGTRNRWGDYSATVLDPSNPHAFWTFQEFVVAEDVWGVRVTQLIFVPEAGTLLLLGVGLTLIVARRRTA